MLCNTDIKLAILCLFQTKLFSQLHAETITAVQSNSTPILKELQETQISTPLIHLMFTKK